MDALEAMIKTMTKEEIRNFKIYLSRIHTQHNRKDEQLFDIIRNHKHYDNDTAAKKLNYADKNAFYRLKNRLLEDISDTLILVNSGKNSNNDLYRDLTLFNIFQSKNDLKLSLYFLKRAEKKAIAGENLEMLDVIFSSYIKLSNEFPEINPEAYIKKQKENSIRLGRLRAIDQVLAAIIYRLKTSQTFEHQPAALLQMLENSIKEFSGDLQLRKSKTFQTRLYRAVSQQLLQNHNYQQLERFMRKTIQSFKKENWFDKNNHDTKLQMQVYLVNALFRNGKYDESIQEAEVLGKEILAYGKLHYDKYVFYYYNALYINYSRIDINKAIKALDELDRVMKQLKNSYYEQFILLNKSTLLFEQKKYNEAIRQLVRLYLNDSYRNASETFKLKINVGELIMQWESGDMKVFKNRLKQVRNQFSGALKKQDNRREKNFLNILEKMSYKNWQTDKKISKQIRLFIDQKRENTDEESELLNYRQWLLGKIMST
jgi:predicted negative regulator of RcsB-dependent stress response